MRSLFPFVVGALLSAPALGQAVVRMEMPPAGLRALPMRVIGRVVRQPDGSVVRQWPATYFETAFSGRSAFFRVGEGEVSLKVSVDDGPPVALVRPAPGTYRVGDLAPGRHRLRIDVASESQGAPTRFGGFLAPPATRAAAIPTRVRQIEFIGDSHTVGYGNTSPTRDCSRDQVWLSTDATRGIGPLVAANYRADYEVNAISGRGVVRNYGGFVADTLPDAYPFALLSHTTPARGPGWHPQVVVIALGTNDFSTPLKPGERWSSRDALHADFEARYVRFVRELRRRDPDSLIVLWATEMAAGEIEGEVARVADRLKRAGDWRIAYVPVNGLAFSACDAHPSLADDRLVAAALTAEIDRHPAVWRR